MKKQIILIALMIFSGFAYAAPLRFNFEFVEADPGTANTSGYIVFESTLLDNPGGGSFNIPDALILDLQITVTGTAGGDGVFTLNDFNSIAFGTGGIALDFSRELVGQTTDTLPWGTTGQRAKSIEVKGEIFPDFNLFANVAEKSTGLDLYNNSPGILGVSGPPNGVQPFTLRASSGEIMAIVSFAPFAVVPIPSLNSYSIFIFGILLLLIGFFTLRKRI